MSGGRAEQSDETLRCEDERRADGTPYTIRPFEPADIDAVRRLYEAVSGEQPTPGWLEWKFLENPAISEVSMFVADGPDGVLGIRPFYPVRMRVGDDPVAATCLVNAMVHPDYQGTGVFSALSDCALEYLSERSDLLFCFANSNSRPIYEHWGWTEVDRMHAHFRFQNPGALVPGDGAWTRPAGTLLTAGARGYLGVRDRLSSRSTDVSVTRTDGVPAARLAALYERAVPDTLHVVRDAEYYEWRLDGPNWSGDVYTATRNGADVAAFVVQTRAMRGGTTRVEVSDALPLTTDRVRENAFGALLDRVLDDNRSADVVSVQGTRIPNSLLRARGFVPSSRFPLSWLYERLFDPLTLFAEPVTDVPLDVSDPDNWDVNELTRNTN
jgi:GNAT superfamily N-acetyltransferase